MNRDSRATAARWMAAVILLAAGALAAPPLEAESPATETATNPLGAAPASGSPLAGTDWRLVEFQSMDDSIGTLRAEDPSLYTMRLNRDGTVDMKLDCNRANGSWSIDPGADGSSGRFEFGPLATTRALCPPPGLDERIAADAQWIRGYLLRDGKLYLSLMADAGIYAWEPNRVEQAEGRGGARENEVRTETVRFEKGTSGTTIEDSLKGYESVQYLLGAAAGQRMTIRMTTESGAAYFNLFEPGKVPGEHGAMFIGSTEGRSYEGSLPASGDYLIQVYQMRSAARREEVAEYTLEIAIVDDGDAPETDVKVPGTSDAGEELSATKQSDLHLIRIGSERIEVPDAVVFGG